MKILFLLPTLLLYAVLAAAKKPAATALQDILVLGNPASEKAHLLQATNSKMSIGGLHQTNRILLPPDTASWSGGSISFTLKTNATLQNYITVKFWGSDFSANRLYIVCNGKQVGYRHLGDIDMLDVGSDGPFYNGRFFYNTTLLPLSLTQGKTEVQIEIRSQGPIWGYGDTWEKYQKNMTEPTRGIYNIYTHTSPAFTPPATEIQGKPPVAKKRQAPGEEIIDVVKQRVNAETDRLTNSARPLNQVQMQLLAKAWHVQWSNAYHNPIVVDRVMASLDTLYAAYIANPRLAWADPATYNPEWFGLGICGQVLQLLKEPLAGKLNDIIPGANITRKEGYAGMLLACRTWHQQHRRMYTNQSMINDLYGIYYANKGLQSIGSTKAAPEEEMLRYLYESLGMQPWLGSDDADGKPTRSSGDNYMQLTAKGLTKELGYVGNYGEVLDWVTEIYEATKPSPQQEGNAAIKKQIEKIALARSFFRYPMLDKEGNAAMRMETVVGWRDSHYPGDVTYAQRPSWDGSPFQIAAATLHPKLVAFSQQMLQDNQFFSVLQKQLEDKGFRTTAGLLQVPEQYLKTKEQPVQTQRLPLSWEEPDVVFADEEDGVIAIKNGKEVMYASLYWRARYAINNLARVHYITPFYNNISTVRVAEKFEPSGLFYTLPDWTNMGFGNGGIKYPDGLHSAYAGEKQPIAKVPVEMKFRPGQENPYAGRADYYELHYGRYLIAMNSSADKEFDLLIPSGFQQAKNLVTGLVTGKVKSMKIKSMSTVVLFR